MYPLVVCGIHQSFWGHNYSMGGVGGGGVMNSSMANDSYQVGFCDFMSNPWSHRVVYTDQSKILLHTGNINSKNIQYGHRDLILRDVLFDYDRY